MLPDVPLLERLLEREAALRGTSTEAGAHLAWMHPPVCPNRPQQLRDNFTACVPRPAGSWLMADGTHWCDDVHATS